MPFSRLRRAGFTVTAFEEAKMNKKKSIALLVIISIVLVVLAVLTFAQFRLPFKNGTKIYQSFLLSLIHI